MDIHRIVNKVSANHRRLVTDIDDIDDSILSNEDFVNNYINEGSWRDEDIDDNPWHNVDSVEMKKNYPTIIKLIQTLRSDIKESLESLQNHYYDTFWGKWEGVLKSIDEIEKLDIRNSYANRTR